MDATILRANTQADVGRAQDHQVVADFLKKHTAVPVSALKVSGPEAGKAFVLKFMGDPGQARGRAEQLLAFRFATAPAAGGT